MQVKPGKIAQRSKIKQGMPQFVHQDFTTVFAQFTRKMRRHEKLELVVLGICRDFLAFCHDGYAPAFRNGLGYCAVYPRRGFLVLCKHIQDAPMADEILINSCLKIDA